MKIINFLKSFLLLDFLKAFYLAQKYFLEKKQQSIILLKKVN